MEKEGISSNNVVVKGLMKCFKDSFINADNELILVPKTNLFLNLNTIYSEQELRYRVIASCSRSCISEKSQSKYWARVTRNSVNEFLGTNFEEGDFRLLYDKFGNRSNEEEAMLFIEEGMDITQFNEWNEGYYTNRNELDCKNYKEKIDHWRDTGVLPPRKIIEKI